MEPNNNQSQTPPQTPPQQPAPQASNTSTPPPSQPVNQGMSNDTRTLIVILLLIFFPLIGIILMWAWMKTWPVWLKVLITLPALLTLAIFIFAFYMILRNPMQIENNNTQQVMEETPTPSPFDEEGTPSPTASPSAEIENELKSALDSNNYEAIAPLMAQSVQFEIEASEGVPEGNPEQTVESLSYLDTATPPWNFDQNDPIVMQIKEDNPEEYGELIIGIASNDVMAAFGLNENGEIDIIKVAVTYEIMISQ